MLFRHCMCAALVVLGAVSALAQTDAPADLRNAPELAPLRELLPNESKAITALRQFDLAQQALCDWDLDLAEELAQKNEQDLAEERVAVANHRIELVRKGYELFLAAYPNNPIALNGYGEIMFDRYGDEAAGLEKWQTAAALDGSYSAPRNNLALFYSHRGSYELAFKYMDEALEMDSDNPDYLFNASQLYLIHFPQLAEMKGWDKKKIYEKAMDMSERAAKALPDDYQLTSDYAVNFYVAPNFDTKPDWAKAAKAWEMARTAAIEPEEVFYTWLNEARVWRSAEKWDAAERAVNEALKILPDSDAAHIVLQQIKEREVEKAE